MLNLSLGGRLLLGVASRLGLALLGLRSLLRSSLLLVLLSCSNAPNSDNVGTYGIIDSGSMRKTDPRNTMQVLLLPASSAAHGFKTGQCKPDPQVTH